jgi:hypothetical protein
MNNKKTTKKSQARAYINAMIEHGYDQDAYGSPRKAFIEHGRLVMGMTEAHALTYYHDIMKKENGGVTILSMAQVTKNKQAARTVSSFSINELVAALTVKYGAKSLKVEAVY